MTYPPENGCGDTPPIVLSMFPYPYYPIQVASTLHVSRFEGGYTVTANPDWDVACVGDYITGSVDFTVYDRVSDAQRALAPTLDLQLAYSTPSCQWARGSGGGYSAVLHTAGDHIVNVSFSIQTNEVGTYGLWLRSDQHFILNLNTSIDWTLIAMIEVVDCSVHASPTLFTVPVPPDPKEGDTIYDIAIIAGGVHPTGTIEFRLYDDTNPSSPTLVFTSVVDAAGHNGAYRSGDYTLGFGSYPPMHWEASYSGDGNNDPADSGPEPIEIEPIYFQPPTATDRVGFQDIAYPPEEAPLRPGIAKFQHSDSKQLWFTPTDLSYTGPLSPIDEAAIESPLITNILAIGSQQYYAELIDQAGTLYEFIKQLDDLSRPMQYVMGLTFNVRNGDMYAALTPEEDMAYTPHDICWFPNNSGLLVAVVPSSGVLEFRKYDLDGNLIHTYAAPDVDVGWTTEPVKIDITCDSRYVFYTCCNNTIFRYDLVDEVNILPYQQLPGGSPYVFGALRVVTTGTDVDNLDVIVARFLVGERPRRGVALGPRSDSKYTVWADEIHHEDTLYRVYKRYSADGVLVLSTPIQAEPGGTNDLIFSLACRFSICLGRVAQVTLIGAT